MKRFELLALSDDGLLELCTLSAYRASGPGGQHRNTTDSAVRLVFRDPEFPDIELVTTACEQRSQHRNRKIALQKMRLQVAMMLREDMTPEIEQVENLKIGMKDGRYPEIVARVFDALHVEGFQVGNAARSISQSTGKLIRFLARDSVLWAEVNRQRQLLNLHTLKAPS